MATYYLLCDPVMGTVTRKSHDLAKLSEPDLVSLQVDKQVWKNFRAGDVVSAAHLPRAIAAKWINARLRVA